MLSARLENGHQNFLHFKESSKLALNQLSYQAPKCKFILFAFYFIGFTYNASYNNNKSASRDDSEAIIDIITFINSIVSLKFKSTFIYPIICLVSHYRKFMNKKMRGRGSGNINRARRTSVYFLYNRAFKISRKSARGSVLKRLIQECK